MNIKQFRRAASAIAAATLIAGVMAVPVSAAVPNGSSSGVAYNFSGDGWAGFEASYSYDDSSTLAKLYLEIDLLNSASVPYFTATKNSNSVTNSCSVTPAVIQCLFKTVRSGDDFVVSLGVIAATPGDVTARGNWSSTGYVPGGNNSHGDAWELASSVTENDTLVAVYGGNLNTSEGFGNRTLNTSTTNLGGNGQAATLKNLPSGKYAYVNDNARQVAGSDFEDIQLIVNDGQDVAGGFQLVIVYPKGTTAPKSFEHYNDNGDLTDTYGACPRRVTTECFVWSNKNNTVTLYLNHNGMVRRT